ncbi:MMPL family transporter [Auraticoccus monumenti]|uniref:Putative drug exporter of the RND superfamily n=1 Tax=Auraticoccus monumenti TaxID=675864 RepID=A0A1G7E0K9_9ACTN|nr:MMPL family transporter [Auraticoccus monumenti]SDE57217.1 putative drug exporter of the RND superfamily [Auraticoccus monumenti]
MPAPRVGSAATAAVAGAARLYRATVTSGRWVVLLLWVLAAAATTLVPSPPSAPGGGFGNLLPPGSAVLEVEERVLEQFRVPVLSGTTVVVHQPGGLSVLTRADSLLWALSTTQEVLESPVPPGPGQIQAAIPVPTGRADTTVTYLFFTEGTGLTHSTLLAQQYAAHFNNQAGVGSYVTGFVPAQVAQNDYLQARLPLFEGASVLLILLVVALAFRSLLAPLVVLGVAGVGYLVYFSLLGSVATALGTSVPAELKPVLVALLLGVVTDYCVLFFASFRDELDAGESNVTAARRSLRRDGPVVAMAGLTVAGGTIALLAAPFEIFRALGPALALTVLVGLAVSLTLTPALMTVLGWRLFTVLPVRTSRRAPSLVPAEHAARRHGRLTRLVTVLTRRRPAVAATVLVVGLLALASLPASQARLDLSFTAGLPDRDSVAEGAALLQQSGLRGLSAPTEVLIEQSDVIAQRPELARLQDLLASQPGVVRVLGPADSPLEGGRGVVLAASGDAARYLVVFGSDPLAAQAIDDARAMQERLPVLVEEAGLGGAAAAMTGQTLIAAEVAELTRTSLELTVVVALLIELLLLALYLRAVVAPVVLLASTVLSVAAALGLTTLLFQGLLGEQGLTFYAPFAVTVLLIALGSDYNVFSVGGIWAEARRRPLREALTVAVPRSSHAITTAGAILAATFALVAIIPLSTFRQIAFAMAVGLLLDTFVLRPVLTPAVLTLLGRAAGWPGHRITVASAAPAGTGTEPGPTTEPSTQEPRRD